MARSAYTETAACTDYPRLCAALAATLALTVEQPRLAAEPWRGTLRDRVAGHRAIEEVLWRHRIWPADNAAPKPPLRDVLPERVLRQRAEEAVRKSNALEQLWGQRITTAQLQGEIDRMARNSKDRAMLAELWSALGNDPERIAECLARPLLVDRRLREAYARDPGLHADVKARSEAALAGRPAVSDTRWLGGDYRETTFVKHDGGATHGTPDPGRVLLDKSGWEALHARLDDPSRRRAAAERVVPGRPAGVPSALREDSGGFFVEAVLEREPDRVVLATLTWSKRPFEEWWEEKRGNFPADMPRSDTSLRLSLPSLASGACTPDTWSEMDPDLPSPTAFHSAVWTGTEMIVWSGSDSQFSQVLRGGRYNPATDTWAPLSSIGAPNALFPHVVWTGDRMIVWGGVRPGHWVNSGSRYDPASDSWSPMSTTDAPIPRAHASAIWTGTRMIVWGGEGGVGDTGAMLGDGGIYDPATNTWAPVSTAGAPLARVGHTAVWTGSRMIVWGGWVADAGPIGQTTAQTGGRFDPTTGQWQTTRLNGAPTPRAGHTAVATGGEMIVWGGESQDPTTGEITYPTSGARYNPANNQWTDLSTPGAPPPRMRHTAVWTGTEMIVWGGSDGWGSYADGARYRLSTDQWLALSNSGGPTPRVGHSAVWTGSHMVVWGGYDPFRLTDTGGRYDPTANTWEPTAASHRPRPRTEHAAIWTGSEMIVWGGRRSDGNTAGLDGGRYLPATDSWTQTSAAGEPSVRRAPTAVWTGTEMIVWGGRDSLASPVSGGGRYAPLLDSWTPISSAGEPAARSDHSAVWTGTRMVVWGGFVWGGYGPVRTATGGIYDPALDAWTPTSELDAATPRGEHAAVWTGREMIIWGGNSEGGAFPSYVGARYDVSAGTWAPMSTVNNPDPGTMGRSDIAAVWTGREMLAVVNQPAAPAPAGVYDPRGDTWRSIASPGPAADDAAWLCGRAVVHADDLRGFDAASGAWITLPPPPTLGGRGAPAVSTGNQILLWGEEDNGFAGNRGSAYCGCALAMLDPVQGLGISREEPGSESLSWFAVPGATAYDVIRGSLAQLIATHGDFALATETCLASATQTASVADPTPPSAAGTWYLVRGRSRTAGTYDSGGPRQFRSRDAQIAASGAACP